MLGKLFSSVALISFICSANMVYGQFLINDCDSADVNIKATGSASISIDNTAGHFTHGTGSMEVVMTPSAGGAGFNFNKDAFLIKDWTQYNEFKFDVYNPNNSTAIFDIDYLDASDGKLTHGYRNSVAAGALTTYSISVSGIPNVSTLTRVLFSIRPDDPACTLCFDYFRLEGGGPPTYKLSGKAIKSSGAGISGVAITLTGNTSSQYLTLADGYYEFNGLVEKSTCVVTPSKNNWTFAPPSLPYLGLNAGYSNQNFTGTYAGATYTIDGFITDKDSRGISGVTLKASGSGGDAVTSAANGYYKFEQMVPGYYSITPSKTGYAFEPPDRSYTPLSDSQTGQLYTGNISAELGSVRLFNNEINITNNGQVTLVCNLVTSGRVKIKVYDFKRTLVKVIADEDFNAGLTLKSWDGKDSNGAAVPSGIYLIKTQAPGFSTTKKVCVIK
ncbi:MAG: carboxypeptidase regulatory-like domain-containing protein [Elusimicrobia bacterium]|nr:carboxypeptidase regulatory-like domain-containing protein [Elusimicrobiota bacterium]